MGIEIACGEAGPHKRHEFRTDDRSYTVCLGVSDSDLLGEMVKVWNPVLSEAEAWRGKALAIAHHPTILIEDEAGNRLMLPLHWVKLDD